VRVGVFVLVLARGCIVGVFVSACVGMCCVYAGIHCAGLDWHMCLYVCVCVCVYVYVVSVRAFIVCV